MPDTMSPIARGTGPLVERELLERGPVQLELSRLLHGAQEGRGTLVFLGGEAGIGKTALVQRFAARVAGRTRVLIGACDPFTTPRALGPLWDMRDGFGARLAELLDSGAGRDVLFRSFLAEIGEGREATVVVLEDVHWGDDATLDLLRFLARRVVALPALVIATYRDDEVGEGHPLRVVLGDTATQAAVRRLGLEPLSLAAVRRLAAGTPLDPLLLHQRTGGNPFFVTEALETGGEGVPATVRDAVLARASRLPEGARAVLGAASVLGLRFEPWLLETVAGADPDTIQSCVSSGMLHPAGERLAFGHELAREALLGALPASRRQALHRAALDALRAAPGEPEYARLAHHAEGALDADAVLDYAPEAARRARALSANREAMAQLQRALRFADRLEPAAHATLLEEYSYAAGALDRFDLAIDADHRIIELWQEHGDRRREGWAWGFLAGCLLSVGRVDEAEAAISTSIAILEPLAPGPELAEAYLSRGSVRGMDRDLPAAREWVEKALALAEAAGDHRLVADCFCRLGGIHLLAGDPEGKVMIERGIAIAAESGHRWEVAVGYQQLAAAYTELRRFDEAGEYLSAALEYVTEHELEAFRASLLSMRAHGDLYRGRWVEAEAAAEELLSLSGIRPIMSIMARAALGRLLARRGDADPWPMLDDALAIAQGTPTLPRRAAVRAARAEAAWFAGDSGRAAEEARVVLDLAVERRLAWLAGELLCWLHRCGERIEAPAWIAPPFALEIAGQWEAAAEEWRRRGCEFEAGLAELGSGDATATNRALGTFRALGAGAAVRHAERKLRELGVHSLPRGPRASTLRNPAGLTARQLEILHQLAEGRTNAEIGRRLFLSAKTVGHHVSAVLAKLGAGTRAEAVHTARRMGVLDDS